MQSTFNFLKCYIQTEAKLELLMKMHTYMLLFLYLSNILFICLHYPLLP